MAKQLRGGRRRAPGLTAPAPAPRAAKHGGATEGSQTEERAPAGGMEGVERLRKEDEGSAEARSGADMMGHKSPVAD